MPNLFGIDIAAQVAAAFSGQLVPGTITRTAYGSRTPGSLTAGGAQTTTTVTFEGIKDGVAKKYRDEDTTIRVGDVAILMLAGSFSTAGFIPQNDDQVTIEGDTYKIMRTLERDPAAATYLVLGRK